MTTPCLSNARKKGARRDVIRCGEHSASGAIQQLPRLRAVCGGVDGRRAIAGFDSAMALRKNGKMKHAITPLSSTNTTFFYKRIFPVLFFGFVSMLFVVGLVRVIDSDPILYLPFVIVPVLMGIFSYQYMKKFSFNLVDEVLDVGDALIVRSGGREERIALADITNVNYVPYGNPSQVTLSLRRPSVFGDTIVFCGPTRFMPLSSDPIIEKLVHRIDAARRGH